MTLRTAWICAALSWCALGAIAPGAAAAPPIEGITLHQPGYSASSLASLPSEPGDIEIDAAGNLFVPFADGIRMITPGGVISPWSGALVRDLTLVPDGSGYGSGLPLCHCIVSIGSDGSSVILHQDASTWERVAVVPAGTLYAAIGYEPDYGFSQINRSTGEPTLVVSGGPGVGGDGTHGPLAVGSDNNLYMLGRAEVAADNGGSLFRLDGSQFTSVATLSTTFFQCGMTGLTRGPSGTLFAARQVPLTTGGFWGEVWIIDPATGNSTLLASGDNSFAIGFDPSTGLLYIAEQRRLFKLWVVTTPSTPALAESWGSVKARYRGGPAESAGPTIKP